MRSTEPFVTRKAVPIDGGDKALLTKTRAQEVLRNHGLAHSEITEVTRCHITDEPHRAWYAIFYTKASSSCRYFHSVGIEANLENPE